MTDPAVALASFQQALNRGQIRLQRGALDPNLYVYQDVNGTRLTYVRLEGRTVTALAMFVNVEPIDGVPCFQTGYAVPEKFRKQGRAQEIIEAAIAELQKGLARNNVPKFCVEAIIAADNEASKRVAEKVLSTSSKATTDEMSGTAAIQYLRNIGG
ncbi:MAG: GNAT N-acetyltransferase [Reyranella sp.]|nr:GNAT N-acetyltransferase [Reyranella sp.]